jgi:NAD(P)-dependent dehydrogenase (short-subunit alcohol dehydrogenase family)
MTDRSERTVLTTGANSGVGLATVVHLGQLGFHSVGSVRTAAKAAAVAGAAEKAGVSVETVRLEVTDPERCAAVIAKLRPWALVNNAGYLGLGAIEDVTDDEARQQFETMVLAPLRLARFAVPHMREAGGGRIVNISSIYGRTTTPLTGWYQATKHALEAATDALRTEVARDEIRVILIEPGGLRTGLWEELDQSVGRYVGSLYNVNYERTRTLVRAYMGFMTNPTRVAQCIGKALTSGGPRARYVIGPDAQTIAAAQALIPTCIRDRVTRLVAGL